MIFNKNIKEDTVRELKYLSDKIDKDIAQKDDYVRYHVLLNEAGIDDKTIKQKLSKFNINDLEEYYQKRKDDTTRRSMEGAILGVVIGLALVVLYFWAVEKGTKKNV